MAELEAAASRLCAIPMTPDERQGLEALHRASQAAVREGGIDEDERFDQELPRWLRRLSTPTCPTCSTRRARLAPFRRAEFNLRGRLASSWREHEAVVQAILRGDGDGAARAMREHLAMVSGAAPNTSPSSPISSAPERSARRAALDIPVHSIAALRRATSKGDGAWSGRRSRARARGGGGGGGSGDLDRRASPRKTDRRSGGARRRGAPRTCRCSASLSRSRTTSTSPDFRPRPLAPLSPTLRERTATVGRAAGAAGAILVGKTNLDQFATGLVGVRSPYGAPRSRSIRATSPAARAPARRSRWRAAW